MAQIGNGSVEVRRAWRLTTGVLAAAASAMALMPLAASAATQADYDTNYCDGGSLVNHTTKNFLSNGTMYFGWCANSSGKMTTATVKYSKDAGSAVSIRFGYEWTNSNGGAVAGTWYDSTGAVTVKKGQTWGARFRRSPAEAPPSSNSTCMRGIMKVNGTTVYSTGVSCR
jgi:hypothetical protein